MGQLAKQLADDSSFCIRLGESVNVNQLNSDYDFVIQAHNSWESGSRQVTTDYFISDSFKPSSPLLYLNGNSEGAINHLAPISSVSKAYSLDGKSLLSVNLIEPYSKVAENSIKSQLNDWFPGFQFEHLKRYEISRALPILNKLEVRSLHKDGVYYCGDGQIQPSIQGALLSARQVAEEILGSMGLPSN